jgi:hypothetical protein
MFEFLFGLCLGGFVMKLWYLVRMNWFRGELRHYEDQLHEALNNLESLEVKVGMSEPDWELNDYVEEGEEWYPFGVEVKKYEA